MKTRAISLASTLSYIGSTGSGSVSGYYTIWTARINERNEVLGQPTPRKINQTLADLKKFRGQLYRFCYQPGDSEIEACWVAECPRCGVESLVSGSLCLWCTMEQ